MKHLKKLNGCWPGELFIISFSNKKLKPFFLKLNKPQT